MTNVDRAHFEIESCGPIRWLSMPAWLLSMVFHLAVFLLAAIVVRPATVPPSNEPDRAASIVVARATDQQPVAYLQDSAAAASERAADASASASAVPPSSAGDAPLVTGIELPKALSLAGADTGVSSSELIGSGRGTRPTIASGEDEALVAEIAKPGPAGSQASPIKVSIFGSAVAEGRSFVFLIDHSKSMGAGGLDVLAAAERQLTSALSRLTPEHQFQIIAYNERPTFLGGRVLHAATDENKHAVQRFFAEIVATGATEHELALHSALRLRPEVLFLLTDGGDPQLNAGQLREIRKHAAGRTSIHCVQFGFGPLQERDSFLQRLARENGGTFHYFDVSR